MILFNSSSSNQIREAQCISNDISIILCSFDRSYVGFSFVIPSAGPHPPISCGLPPCLENFYLRKKFCKLSGVIMLCSCLKNKDQMLLLTKSLLYFQQTVHYVHPYQSSFIIFAGSSRRRHSLFENSKWKSSLL